MYFPKMMQEYLKVVHLLDFKKIVDGKSLENYYLFVFYDKDKKIMKLKKHGLDKKAETFFNQIEKKYPREPFVYDFEEEQFYQEVYEDFKEILRICKVQRLRELSERNKNKSLKDDRNYNCR
jgi:hypothetical protein